MTQTAEGKLRAEHGLAADSCAPDVCPVINRDRCVYCRRCAEVCSAGAPYREGDSFVIDYDLCTACGACLKVCRTDAISMPGVQNTASTSASRSSA